MSRYYSKEYDNTTIEMTRLKAELASLQGAQPAVKKDDGGFIPMVFVKYKNTATGWGVPATVPVKGAPNFEHNRIYLVWEDNTSYEYWRTPNENDYKRMKAKGWEMTKA